MSNVNCERLLLLFGNLQQLFSFVYNVRYLFISCFFKLDFIFIFTNYSIILILLLLSLILYLFLPIIRDSFICFLMYYVLWSFTRYLIWVITVFEWICNFLTFYCMYLFLGTDDDASVSKHVCVLINWRWWPSINYGLCYFVAPTTTRA